MVHRVPPLPHGWPAIRSSTQCAQANALTDALKPMCQLKLELSCIAPVMVYGYGASCLDSSQLWAHVCGMKGISRLDIAWFHDLCQHQNTWTVYTEFSLCFVTFSRKWNRTCFDSLRMGKPCTFFHIFSNGWGQLWRARSLCSTCEGCLREQWLHRAMKVLQFSHFLMMVGDLPFNNLHTQRPGRLVL